MKKISRFLLLALLAGTPIVFSSCEDDKKVTPVTTGTVNGQITPANAVTTVTATSTATPVTTATATPNSTGAYSFTGLAAGTYTLSFTPATGFAAPATQSVTVTAGGTTTATAVTVTTTSSTASGMTYTVGGSARTAGIANAQVLLGSLVITGTGTTGALQISLDGFNNAAGTFTLSATSNSAITYTEIAGTSFQEFTTYKAGGSGTVTITSVSTSPRRVSGTFTAVAPGNNGATGTRTITNGTFSNLSY